MQTAEAPRVELFRLLGDEDRLRLLALCAQEELAVGELAELLQESQPQVSRKVAPLRQSGLLSARRDGTRTLLHAVLPDDPVVQSGLEEGRRLCQRDGSMARVARVVLGREEQGRRFFEAQHTLEPHAGPADAPGALWFLSALAPLWGPHALCVDVGTGEGSLLPLLAPLFTRVLAVDRSPSRLARCAARVAREGLDNVRLLEGSAFEGTAVLQEVSRLGGADLVVMARTLHHAARPVEAVAACARLLRTGGRILVLDYLPHEEEEMREQGDVWLGFPPDRLRALLQEAGLDVLHLGPLPLRMPDTEPDAHLPFQLALATRRNPAVAV